MAGPSEQGTRGFRKHWIVQGLCCKPCAVFCFINWSDREERALFRCSVCVCGNYKQLGMKSNRGASHQEALERTQPAYRGSPIFKSIGQLSQPRSPHQRCLVCLHRPVPSMPEGHERYLLWMAIRGTKGSKYLRRRLGLFLA